jgi:hypothetical protein
LAVYVLRGERICAVEEQPTGVGEEAGLIARLTASKVLLSRHIRGQPAMHPGAGTIDEILHGEAGRS